MAAGQLLQRRSPRQIVRGYQEQKPALLRLDWWVMGSCIGLFACGLLAIWVATSQDIPGSPLHYVTRQAIYGAVGLVCLLLIARVDFMRLRPWFLWFYGAILVSNVFVLLAGAAARGSKRWIELPGFTLQPSEVGKLLLVLAIAGFVAERSKRLFEIKTTLEVVGLALLPALIVIVQPDLGSGVVYMIMATAILFVAGTKWTHFAALGTAAVVAIGGALFVAPELGIHVLKPYQVDRLTAFVHPSNNPQSQGYQLNQSVTAIGAGETLGRGPSGATQTKLNFLPEHHTDFVFSVIGESFGFAGAMVLLALYGVLLWRAIRIIAGARNLYGTLIAGGITAMLIFQIFLNIAMTVGLMPVTGVPLPLISYGGSSVIVTFLAIGLLQSVRAHGREAT
jgi:rod shape determining protein RodA